MKKLFPVLLLFIISLVFFYKSIIFFRVPFPGDILIADYAPWKYESYLGYNPGSYPNKAQYFDVIRQMYPWKIFAVSELKSGRFPLWNPYNFSGMPFFANNQSAVLNPLNLLFFVATPTIAWSIFIYLQPLLASLFMYLYLRSIKLSKVSAVFGSVAFSYSLFMAVFLEYGNYGYSYIYLPLLLFLVEKMYLGKYRFGIFIPVVISVMFFSGHLQISAGALIFTFAYTVFRFFLQKEKNGKALITLTIYMLLGIGLSLVQLLPLFELISNSARVAHNMVSFKTELLLQIHQLLLFVAPDTYGNPATGNYLLKDSYPGNAVYIGVVPLIFSIYAFRMLKSNKYLQFFFITFTILLIFLTNNAISSFVYSFDIPFVSSSSPANWIFLSGLSLAVIASFGMERWKERFDRNVFIAIGILFLLVAIFIGLNKLMGIPVNVKQVLLGCGIYIVSAIAIASVFLLKKEKYLYIILLVLVCDLLYYFLKFNPFVPAELVFPPTPITKFLSKTSARSWGYSAGNVEPNFQTYFKIYSPEGYDPLYPRWYGELLYSSRNGRLLTGFDDTTRSQAQIANGYAESDFTSNKLRLKILNETGTSLILNRVESATGTNSFPKDQFLNIYNSGGWSIYKNLNARPRAFLTNLIDTYVGNKQFERKFFNSSSVLLDKEQDIHIGLPGSTVGKATISQNFANKVVVKTDSKTDSLLVLLDTYYPGWKATIDSRPVNIIRANYTFRAVPVEKGRHTVVFSYQPTSFYLGLILTIISGVAIGIVYIVTIKFIK